MLTTNEARPIRAILFDLFDAMRQAPRVATERWQAIDVRNNPAAETHELRWLHLHFDLAFRDLDYYVSVIKPDLPWADDHFAERVSGQPLNPPPSEAWWPHGQGANGTFKEGEQFNHTYPERFWPKYARMGQPLGNDARGIPRPGFGVSPHRGIQYEYGDLEDLVRQMLQEPFNRQGILPMFFPEDTGVANPGRKPCTLHYHFMRRGHVMDVEYSIRSCDYFRHFKNDVYFAIRLLLWMLDELNMRDQENWHHVRPGQLIMNIGSLHVFRNDYIKLYGAS